MSKVKKALRGFAAMTPERRKEIASRGGKAVPPEARAFSVSRELAEKAGRKGGLAVPSQKRAFSVDRSLAKKAGKLSRLDK